MQADRTIIDAAIAWHLRQDEMSPREWEAFTLWLEADPAHASAYDRVAMDDRLIAAAVFPAPQAANDDMPLPGHRRGWSMRGWVAGGAMAAALAVVAATGMLTSAPSGTYVVATPDGQPRTVTLADGTRIEMSGGTRLTLDRGDPRTASLESGEITLHVRHDEKSPFTLQSGGLAIRDLGTVFDVARTGTRTDVAVAEGSVMLAPADARVVMTAGDAAAVADGRIVRSKVTPDEVGGWRRGHLSFDAVPLGTVAARIGRLYGFRLTLAGDLSSRPFTGMVAMTGTADRDVPHLADLIGATWRRDGKAWILASEATTPR
ncbi:FecR domain-containing protein [Sphingomonas sp.]|uniref:FecR family protein n=1 Tax=Sphingomonas sp. TaxID=28214 RepID=UPI002582C7E5|nr:FecR domain-containing protein [Sphingomonas sp.]